MPNDDREPLREILAALELPPHALEAWLRDLETFCREHGGEPRYRELMALLRDCREATSGPQVIHEARS